MTNLNDSRDKESLGDRMKAYEHIEADRKFVRRLPVVARLDGRAFHTLTRGMGRPYDARFSECMINTMLALVKGFHANLGYTQSDEISLYFEATDDMVFNGRQQKLHSVLASSCTAHFIREYDKLFPNTQATPQFDCRVWQLPDVHEVTNMFLWREDDATKNSVSMAAQSMFSHKELHLKNGKNMQQMMLEQRNINWNDYPIFFKRGTYGACRVVEKFLTEEELSSIPEGHRPTGPVMRGECVIVNMPPIRRARTEAHIDQWLGKFGSRAMFDTDTSKYTDMDSVHPDLQTTEDNT